LTNPPWWIKNIYFFTGFTFLVWMIFFDKNNSFITNRINAQLNELKDQKTYYETEIKEVNKLKEELFSTDENKEKFARERYLMKKNNEDIFLIVEKK